MAVAQEKKLNEKWLLLANLAANTGHAMIWPVTTLHMTLSLGQSLTMSGLVLLVAALMNVLGSFVAGQLFDRWKPYPALLGATVVAFLSVGTLFFYNGWPVFAILIWTASIGLGGITTLLNAYATTVSSKNTRVIFNNMYIVLNVGVVLGTLVVGYLFDYGFSWLMLIAATLYLVLGIVVSIFFNVETTPQTSAVSAVEEADNDSLIADQVQEETKQEVTGHRPKLKMTALLFWIAGFLLIMYLSYMLWETAMATYLHRIGISTSHYANLWVLNGLTIIIFQKMISNWANKRNYAISVILGGLIFALSFLLMLFVGHFWEIILVFELLTLGEMLASPQVPAWVAQITPKEVSGQAQGFVGMMISLGRMLGPVYGGVMLDHGWFAGLFISVFAGMVLVNLGLYVVARKTKRKRA
ncbi:MFS transporter [Fructobacillus sp. M1-13]|uniref:MFS transporter n=1 Tax=Fructobacillus papyriferae TaxID=2713171 RepID=A0ABS5QT29_9LACO|nr:MFS transporter [Fructobacillus papyriferae]MBS9335474.1 MFS transporter [Fructobacillus papyriferae]MCD2159244.1 MFS transporter [Fructobacillus papyriferae]